MEGARERAWFGMRRLGFTFRCLAGALPRQPKQRAHTPERAKTEHTNEEQIEEVLGCRSLAPGLEHGDESYEEKYDCQGGDTLQKHEWTPGIDVDTPPANVQ